MERWTKKDKMVKKERKSKRWKKGNDREKRRGYVKERELKRAGGGREITARSERQKKGGREEENKDYKDRK